MRSPATSFTALAIAGCATAAEPAPPYDDLAQVIGAQLVTPAGGGELAALGDATMLARGAIGPTFTRDSGMYVTQHEGVTYLYVARCRDRDERAIPCGDLTATAEATAVWGGLMHQPRFDGSMSQGATWTLRGLDRELSWVTGRSWSTFEAAFGPVRNTTFYRITWATDSTWLYDPQLHALRAGNQQGILSSTRELAGEDDETIELTLATSVDRPGRLLMELGDYAYWLDAETGEVTAATHVE